MADGTQPEAPTLKAKREAFVVAYVGIARFNASEAARIAGYAIESAGVEGCRLLKNASVRARVDEYLDAMSLGAKEVLAELTDVATAEWRDFVEILARNEDGEPIRVRMDLSSKIKSLELLGKHHQLFSDNLNINGGIEIHEFVGIPEGTK